MKKLFVLLLATTLAFGMLVGCTRKIQVEENAKIVVSVDNDTWGNAIVAAWDAENPEFKGLIEFKNNGSAGAADQITTVQGEFADVVLVIDGEVGRNAQSLNAFSTGLGKTVKDNAPEVFYNNVNKDSAIYAPITYDGMAFSWNKTMLETLGLDTKDENKDGLPDAFDTFEEIFALGDTWGTMRPEYKGKKLNIIYPFALSEPWSGYSAVTAGGWEIFATGDASKPGFDDPKFAAGLEFLAEAGKHNVYLNALGEKAAGKDMGWVWDAYLSEEAYPFSLVGTWMTIDEAKTGADYKFSKMPTYKDTQLTPFVKTKGFVINAFTKYPKAAESVLNWLYSKSALQVMVNNSSYAPALKEGSKLLPDLAGKENLAEMSAAFAFNYPEPGLRYPANPAKAGMDTYYNISITEYYAQVWDGTMTPADAQAKIVEAANAYFTENNK
jgi:arabinogalactan oligomer / maltooligosaccharide transport system substrate-binding protein